MEEGICLAFRNKRDTHHVVILQCIPPWLMKSQCRPLKEPPGIGEAVGGFVVDVF